MEESLAMHDDLKNMGIGKEIVTSNSVYPPSFKWILNINLEFDNTTFLRNESYHDPMGSYVYKTSDYSSPFRKYPQVNYQCDMFMEEDEAR